MTDSVSKAEIATQFTVAILVLLGVLWLSLTLIQTKMERDNFQDENARLERKVAT